MQEGQKVASQALVIRSFGLPFAFAPYDRKRLLFQNCPKECSMSETDSVLVDRDGAITIISINRPHCRNAVDGATARKLYDAFLAFDADASASVAVFTGTGGYFVPARI